MPVRPCSTCNTPLPAGASFCPTCGVATPTEVRQSTGELYGPTGSVDEAEYRVRLQRALGDDYRLGDLIGRGGFGVVYSAWDIELDREVAVKALRHDLVPTSGLIQRFKREARAAAKLRHSNITPIYAVGEGEGVAYMVMPRLVGENLKAVIERGEPLPIPEIKRILVEAARALEAAHQAGIVHRDIKPENIFLEGDERRVYLMDFGIAKALDTDEEGLTGTGMIVGTPSYMSPEQAGGHGDKIDNRADIYSLGVVGYQLLAGRLPYAADSLQDLIFQQITKEPDELQKSRPETPVDLARAVERCLQTNPEDRWATADALIEGIEGRGSFGTRQTKSRRNVLLLAVPLVVASLGVVGFLTLRGRGGPDEQRQQERPPALGVTAERSGTGDSLIGDEDSTSVAAAPATVPPTTVQSATPQQQESQPATRPPAPAANEAAQRVPEQPPPVGYLTINVDTWGMVQIDGVDVEMTPLTRHELAPGTHIVSVWRDGYRTWTDTLEITAGNETRRMGALVRIQQ